MNEEAFNEEEPTFYSKNGWTGYLSYYRGTPIGMFIIRCRKDSRIITTKPMTPDQVGNFDPDDYWNQR